MIPVQARWRRSRPAASLRQTGPLRHNLQGVSGHIFISYSHEDAASYVAQLATYLTAKAIPVWFDKEIITGQRWAAVVREKIDTSVAVVVVMTPKGDRSEWVSREIDQAQLKRRPVLPLLLRASATSSWLTSSTRTSRPARCHQGPS
jgi:hypothetical protein